MQETPADPGLLWAMAFDGDGRGRLLAPGEAMRELDAFGSGFVWMHHDLAVADLAPLIASGRLGPHALARATFGPDEHQRVSVEADHIGGVVADLPRAGAKPDASGHLHFVMGPRTLVSGRRGPVESPDATRSAAERGVAIASPAVLLETLVGHVVAAMAETGQRLSDQVDAIEDHILDGRVRDDRRRLSPVRRSAVRLHRHLLGLAAVFHRLEEDGAGQDLHGPAVAAAGRLAQRLDALDRDMGLLAERARLLQEELSERVAEETNRQLYVLSILSALFLPPGLVASLFGMNVKGLPLADSPHGFGLVCALAAGTAVAAYAVIRILGVRAPRD